MPETRFTVRWPDGEVEQCYSPSSVMHNFLTADTTYPLEDFVVRCRIGLEKASTRVEARYGSRCSLAEEQLTRIERRAETYTTPVDVICLSIN